MHESNLSTFTDPAATALTEGPLLRNLKELVLFMSRVGSRREALEHRLVASLAARWP